MEHNVSSFEFKVHKSSCTVTIRKEFAADRSLVWDAFTTADFLDRWWAPKPWKSVTKDMDFRVGGRRFYAMVGPEGQEHWSVQEYLAINPKTCFKMLNAFADSDGNPDLPGSVWDLNFDDKNGATMVLITIVNDSRERFERMLEFGFKEGFTSTLGELENLLKANPEK